MESLNDDIEKYLKGELNASERHALEQKALKDPFLAEALEGAESHATHFSLDVELLQRSIKEKSAVRGERRRISLNGWHLYMGIAAGLLVLAVSSFIVLTMMRQQQENKELAYTKSTSKDSSSVTTPQASVPAVDKQDSSIATGESENTGPVASSSRPVERVQLSQPASRNEIEVEAELQEPPVIARRADEVHIADLSDSTSTQSGAGAISRQGTGTIEKLIKGKIVSANDGAELAGVNVLIKGTNKGTISDPNGEFEIGIPDGSDALVFSFIGLKSSEVSLMDNGPLVVKMASDPSQLTEMVVTAEDLELDASLEFPFMEMAEPAGGRNAFKKYLTEKMQYPYQALTNKVEGGVTVQFTVLPSGQLVDFKILNGLGYGCDEEVIRLIKEGPSWAPSKLDDQPVKEDVRIRLKFDLPEKK